MQVTVRIILIGISRRRPTRLAVELGGICITAAIDHLRRQTREKRLCPFSPVQQVKLAFRLCSDQNSFVGVVESLKSEPFQTPSTSLESGGILCHPMARSVSALNRSDLLKQDMS